ncbi:DUF1997 domain-containing protein [Okeania sp.]|uniref:DUF1997 domain-containing protein n=1 Tax=Okeania sp. TaxID=3100323 RepID=UPI002B4B4E34|nr:DUF1997 domain-containing protein [Okeania sp.]MEB3340991.1 DUF1997 domain-containing protein [Okeania sp.]
MHHNFATDETLNKDNNLVNDFYLSTKQIETSETSKITWFNTKYSDCMELYVDAETVAKHFVSHRDWFCRCAHPMKVQPLGENGYDLLIGKFGSFGYQVEARIGLELLPPDSVGIYRIRNIPVPDYTPPGYEIQFQSEMRLVELPTEQFCSQKEIQKLGLSPVTTGAKWNLDLTVGVNFPQFIQKISPGLIQRTGNSLLLKIVHQVSQCLTYKTQIDFHTTYNLPFPKQRNRK